MAKSQHVENFKTTLTQSYNSSGKQKDFSSWLSGIRSSFDQDTANNYYNRLELGQKRFDSIFYYLNQVSNRFGYQTRNGLSISDEIADRIEFISSMTGIKDLDYLNRIFKVSELEDIVSNLTMTAVEAYIFDGEQLGQIPNHEQIFERIGVQVSNGRNKATLEEYLLDSSQSSAFAQAMNDKGSLVLMPTRDANGNINNFTFGIKAQSRGQILNVLRNDLQLTGEQLPINYKDSMAVKILNAVVQGKSIVLDDTDYNFGQMRANFGQRSEALTEAVYQQYTQTGQLLDGTVLQGIVMNQLTRTDEKSGNLMFNVPSNFSGLAGPDMIIEGRYEQNKNFGNSRRCTYGDLAGVLAITGFYGGKNTFNKELQFEYSQMSKEMKEQINEIQRDTNISIWNGLVSVLEENGFDLGDNAYISSDDSGDYDGEDYVSSEDVVDLLMEVLT